MVGTTLCSLNGAMLDNVSLYHSEVTYKEPLLMFRNSGQRAVRKIPPDTLGPDFARAHCRTRNRHCLTTTTTGTLISPINNRGDYPELLRNDGGNANHWLEVLLTVQNRIRWNRFFAQTDLRRICPCGGNLRVHGYMSASVRGIYLVWASARRSSLWKLPGPATG